MIYRLFGKRYGKSQRTDNHRSSGRSTNYIARVGSLDSSHSSLLQQMGENKDA